MLCNIMSIQRNGWMDGWMDGWIDGWKDQNDYTVTTIKYADFKIAEQVF